MTRRTTKTAIRKASAYRAIAEVQLRRIRSAIRILEDPEQRDAEQRIAHALSILRTGR